MRRDHRVFGNFFPLPIGLECLNQAIDDFRYPNDNADFAPRIQLGHAQALTSDKGFATIANNSPGMKAKPCQWPNLEKVTLSTDSPDDSYLDSLVNLMAQGPQY